MALRIKKKSNEGLSISNISSRNSSPTFCAIKRSLLKGFKSFKKLRKNSCLTQIDLKFFLSKLNFTKSAELTQEESADFHYMWNLIARNSKVHLSDAFAYVLSILDVPVPKSLIETSQNFPSLNSSFSYIKDNSAAFLKNYLEHIYCKSKQSSFYLAHEQIKTKTPSVKADRRLFRDFRNSESRIGKENIEKKGDCKKIRTKSATKDARERLKRSYSRNHSRDISGILITSDNRKKSPVIGIELTNVRNKNKNILLYIKMN